MRSAWIRPPRRWRRGTVVNVRGEDGRAFGTGYFNPKSLIAVRLLASDCDAAIDADFFAQRLGRALALRQAVYDRPFYRLCHAEGDGLPGLVIDPLRRHADGADRHRRDGAAGRSDRRGAGPAFSRPRPSSCATMRHRAPWKGWMLMFAP